MTTAGLCIFSHYARSTNNKPGCRFGSTNPLA